MKEKQSFFIGNTHYSKTHVNHGHSPVSTDWSLGVGNQNRASGFSQYKPLGHTNYSGQTTLDMFSPGGHLTKPDKLP